MTGGGDTPSPTPILGPIFATNHDSTSEFCNKYYGYGTKNGANVLPLIKVDEEPGSYEGDRYYYLGRDTATGSNKLFLFGFDAGYDPQTTIIKEMAGTEVLGLTAEYIAHYSFAEQPADNEKLTILVNSFN